MTPPAPPVIVEVIDKVGTETGPLNPHDITDDAQPELKGTAEAGSLVLIYDNGIRQAGAARQRGGRCRRQLDVPAFVARCPEGDHRLTMIARDAGRQ